MSQRYLSRNKACRSPSRLVFWDTETTQRKVAGNDKSIENVFRLGVATRIRLDNGSVSRRSVLRFTERDRYWDWLRQTAEPNTQTYVFAHNLGFDFTITGGWDELDAGRFRLSDHTIVELPDDPRDKKKRPWSGLLVRQDPPTVIKVRDCKNATFTFCDTLNWFHTSLSQLGERTGIPKLQMPHPDDSDERWFKYCQRDVEVIEKCMVDYILWVKKNNLGNFKVTAPSQSFAAFNHRFRKPNILIHSKPEVQSLERESYYGGRLESFYIGEIREDNCRSAGGERQSRESMSDEPRGCVYDLDVNSLYPSIMRELPYPTGLEEFTVFDNPEKPKRRTLCYRCIADVHLRTSDTFPKRIPGVGVVFARGRFRTVLAGQELMRAVRQGSVEYVYKYARYSMKPLFTEFVDFFWTERLKAKAAGDLTGDIFCKLFLNSLYGKFGQLTVEWDELGQSKPGHRWDVEEYFDAVTKQPVSVHNIAGVQYAKHRRTDHPNSFCAIASFVTAYARERMLELMNVAGRENVYYIVTDGIFTSREGYERLKAAGEIDNSALGKLSVKEVAECGWMGGIHWYEVGEVVKRGSNKKKAIVLSNGHALQQRWERLAGILSRCPTDTVRITPQIKKYARQYKRGRVDEVGNVHPLVLDEPVDCSNNA